MSYQQEFSLEEQGIMLYNQGQFDKAKDCFLQALELNSNSIEAYNYLGTIAMLKGDMEAAIGYWKQSLNTEDNFEANNQLGFYYSKAEQLTEARPYLERALTLAEGRADPALQLSFIYSSEGRYAEAEELLTPWMEVPGIQEQAYLLLAEVKTAQALYPEAVRVLESLLQVLPNSIEGHHRLAKVYVQLKEVAKAREYYEKVMTLLPGYLDAIREYGLFLVNEKETDVAHAFLSQSIIDHPQDWELHYLLGCTFELMNSWQESLQSFKKALKFNPHETAIRGKIWQLENKKA